MSRRTNSAFITLIMTGLTACAMPQRLARQNGPADAQTLIALGDRAFEDRHWALARKYFLLAHKEKPENAEAVNKFAITALAEDKDLGRARWMIKQMVPAANTEDAPRLLDTLARIEMREGRFADAKIALDEAQAPTPGQVPDIPDLLESTDVNLARVPQP